MRWDMNDDVKSSLVDIGSEVGEVVLDQFLESGIVQQVPILNLLVASAKAYNGIKKVHTLKKVALFARNLYQDKSADEVNDFLKNNSDKIIDGCTIEEHLNANLDSLIGVDNALLASELFKKLVGGTIDLNFYAKSLDILHRCNIFDLIVYSTSYQSGIAVRETIDHEKGIGLGFYKIEVGPYISSSTSLRYQTTSFGKDFFKICNSKVQEIVKMNNYKI